MLQIDTQPSKEEANNLESQGKRSSQEEILKDSKEPQIKTTQSQKDAKKQTRDPSYYRVRKDRSFSRFTFRDIAYKGIIKSITHSFKAGQMTAILGPSGAGKTTYLKIAAGRKKKTGGRIFLNGQEIKQKELRKRVAYVHQEDHHYPTLTAKEMLTYTVKLKLPNEKDPSGLADKLLSEMGMYHVKDTIIGDPLEGAAGLSGGERKRLSVAQELVSSSNSLFLDEPTSGLDSYTSESLIIHLKNLSKSGILVAMTIHQPSSDIFHMFDNIVIMKDGYIIYAGSPEESMEYMKQIGHECPKYTNPADHIFRVLNKIEPGIKNRSDKTFENIPDSEILDDQFRKKTTFYTFLHEIKILISRTALCGIRNKKYIYAKCGNAISMALITGFFLYNIPAKEPHQIETNVIGCFRTLTMSTFGSFSYGAISILFSDRKIFLKEYSSNYYTFLPYFISKLFVDFLITAMHPIVGAPIIFYLSGIGTWHHIIGCLLLGATAHSLGVLVSSLVDTSEIALAIFPGLAYFINMLTGTDVDPDSIHFWLKPLQYVSPPRHAYNIMIKLHYRQTQEVLSPRLSALVNGFVSIQTSMLVLLLTYMVIISLAGYALKRKIKSLAKG